MSQDTITPDTKDWTWVLERPCPDCGLVASAVPPDRVADAVHRFTEPWAQLLARPDAAQRSRPDRWSPLEYACHVRDVCRVFAGRVRLVLAEDAPQFANWDQDGSAVDGRYAEQDPAVVARQLGDDAAGFAAVFAQVGQDQWGRRGTRSDGSRFTVLTLGRYCLHDLAHHLWDVGVERPVL